VFDNVVELFIYVSCIAECVLFNCLFVLPVLQNVKEQMEVMQDKDTLVTRRNTNHNRLLEHLDQMVVCYTLHGPDTQSFSSRYRYAFFHMFNIGAPQTNGGMLHFTRH
jgi:hypothetical protein